MHHLDYNYYIYYRQLLRHDLIEQGYKKQTHGRIATSSIWLLNPTLGACRYKNYIFPLSNYLFLSGSIEEINCICLNIDNSYVFHLGEKLCDILGIRGASEGSVSRGLQNGGSRRLRESQEFN